MWIALLHRRSLAAAGALLVAALLAGLVQRAGAQAVQRLGVREAVALAEAQSPALNQIRAQIRMKEGAWWAGFGIDAPEVTYFREGIRTGAGGGFAEQRWAVSQRIDFPLHSYYRLRRTRTETDALTLTLEAETAHLRSEVKKAYTDLLYAQELLHLRQEEVTLGQQLLDAATLRAEVGEASELETMKAEIGLAEAQSNLEEARRRFQNARYTLFHVIGLEPDAQRYEIVFPDTLAYIDAPVAQADVLARIEHQPELHSAARALDAARLAIRQTRASLLPALRLDVYPQDYGAGYDAFGIQVGLTLPLWIVPTYRGRLQTARADVQATRWQQTAVALDLKKEAEQAWHGYETSRRTIDRYRTTVHDRADELLRRTLEGYRIGEIDLITLLDTQRTYLSSQLRYYDALRDYYHRLIELERFLGEDIVFDIPLEWSAE